MSKRPNILWLMTDEQRPDSLGCYGSAFAKTPHLDALAAGGALFQTAVTPAPVSVPARGAFLSGRTPTATGVTHNKARFETEPGFLTHDFKNAGYATASFGKQHYHAPGPRAFETEEMIVLGDAVDYFGYKKDYRHEDHDVVTYPGGEASRWVLAGRYPEPAAATPEATIVDHALDWLDTHQKEQADRPFFLRASFNNPHTPVVAPEGYDRLIDADTVMEALGEPLDDCPADRPAWEREFLRAYAGVHRLDRAATRRARQCYYGSVAHVDAQFGRLLDGLRQRGALENTIVVYVSDHGAGLGDCSTWQKQSFYEQVVNVPFFFAWPGRIAPGTRLENPVEALSLLPTLLDLAGLDVPDRVHAPSLADELLHGREPQQRAVFSELDFGTRNYRTGERLIMVRDGRWKLALYRDPRDKTRYADDPQGVLFDLENDPAERVNRFGDAALASVVEELIKKIDTRDAALYGT